MAQIPYSKVKGAFQRFQTGQSAGPVDRHAIVGNPVTPPGVVVAPSHLLSREVEDTLDVVYSPRRCTLVLTPFMAEYPNMQNRLARYCMMATKDSLKRHEAPMATSLFYYATLNIHVSIEKDIGLQSMLSWIKNADTLAIYCDYGITQAMDLCIKTAKMKGTHMEYRNISLV